MHTRQVTPTLLGCVGLRTVCTRVYSRTHGSVCSSAEDCVFLNKPPFMPHQPPPSQAAERLALRGRGGRTSLGERLLESKDKVELSVCWSLLWS